MLRERVVGLEPLHHRGVVRGGERECFERERTASVGTDDALLAQLGEDAVVLIGTGHDRNPRVVLRRCPRHRRSADVDRLDLGLLEERIEVAHHHVERGDAVLLHVGEVRRLAPVGEDPAVHLRVQRDDTVVEHLGEAGDGRERDDGDARLLQRLGGAARRHQLPAQLVELAGEVDESGLVVHREQRARPSGGCGQSSSPSSRLQQRVEHLWIQAALDRLDAFVQRVGSVVGEHGHGFLRQDRPVVYRKSGEMHRTAGDRGPGGQRIFHRVPPLECGQERRMRVHHRVRIRVVDRLVEDGAESRHRHQAHFVTLQRVDDLVRVRSSVEIRCVSSSLD